MARSQIRENQIRNEDNLTEAEHVGLVHENLVTSGTLNFQDGTISGTGDIYCDDLYVSSDTIFLGDTALTEIPAGGLAVAGEGDFSGHLAVGNNASPNALVGIFVGEDFNSTTAYGEYISVDNAINDGGATTVGIGALVQNDASTSHLSVIGGKFTANPTADGVTITDLMGVDATAVSPADNSTITNMIGGKFDTATGFSMSGQVITNVIAGQFQTLKGGSGDINITNGYGILVLTPGSTVGSGINLYGMYIEDQSAEGFDNDYNIYSAGTNSNNKLEGSLAIGSGASINEFSIDGTLVGYSDAAVPTEKAVKTYVDTTVSGISGGSFVWTEVTTNYTSSVSDNLMIDTTISGIQITLPPSPIFGDTIVFVDGADNAATYNVTVLRNGNKIMGLNDDLTINENSAAFDLIYYNTTNGWRVK